MATGGTGGHIYPAVAGAGVLEARGYAPVLMGQAGGMEERIAREGALEFVGVTAGKLAREKPDPRQVLRAARGFAEARGVLARLQPLGVVGFGGFASLPGVLGAQSLGLPTVLHEQNAQLGLTQRLALRRARAVGTAYAQVRGLPDGRGRLVGMPVREARLERRAALAKLGLQDGPLTILIMGGSQGSLALNRAVPSALRAAFGQEGLFADGSVQVIHSTGPRWLGEVLPDVADLPWYRAVGYLDAVAAWSAADLAITRAGTGTLAEAAFHGVPVVMVPLPSSAENHQVRNAEAVEAKGAGRMVPQDALSGSLAQTVLECVPSDVRTSMGVRARERSPQGAAGKLADLVEETLVGAARAQV